jgi:hypothetical protein
MAISRMQNPQQLQGIGSLRQPYGLGKLVKKAFKGVKKIAKSPLGKAALLGGLGMWGMGAGPFAGKAGAGWLTGGGAGGSLWKKLAGSKLGGWFGGLTPGQKIFTGLGGAAVAAPFIQKALKMGPYADEEEVEEEDWSLMPSSISNIVNRAQDYYRQPTSYADFQFMPEKQFVTPNFYAADGGRAGLLNGGEAGEAQIEQMLRAEYLKYKNKGGTMPYEQFKILIMKQAQQGQMPNQMMEAGGRAGYLFGERVEKETDLIEGPQGSEEVSETLLASDPSWEDEWDQIYEMYKAKQIELGLDFVDKETFIMQYQDNMAHGGRVGAQEGGLMDMGGMEKDYREEGGFVPIGGEERADDVPARLSKNEFVFTADAVRAAGGGDIDRGSEVMQNVMDNLEQGGEVSEDSQGLGGGEEIMSEEMVEDINPAQGMFDTYEQLQSRVA